MGFVKLISSFLQFLFPHHLVKETPWYSAWREQNRNDNIFVWRASLPVFAFGYAIHIYIDILHQKPNIEMWITFRLSMTALILTCLGLYMWPKFYKTRFYKLPIYAFVFIACYFQAKTVLWYPLIPYTLALNFVFIGAMVLRGSIVESIIFGVVMIAFQLDPLIASGVPKIRLVSEGTLTIVLIIFARSAFANEVKTFVLGQKRQETQRDLLRLNQEFTEQIKGFLPREIARRLTEKMENHKLSAFQSMQEVLKPKKLNVACLYSDVRGFTDQSRDLDGFVQSSLLPNLEAVTEVVEEYQGIPRKVGDLIFSYYDSSVPQDNIQNALKSAIRLVEINIAHNTLHPSLMVKRHTLLSYGPAIVGNLSSNHSAIEISAIGTPVNLLSRVDEVSKLDAFKKHLSEIDIVMSEEAYKETLKLYPNVEIKTISLDSIKVKIRSFSEVTHLYILPVNAYNRAIIMDNVSLPLLDMRKVA